MSHYNAAYFQWQRQAGFLAGQGNLFFYQPFIEPQHSVVDFGCGGAYLLANLRCANKLGIEINEEARHKARTYGISTVAKAEQVQEEWADIIISCHALEHTSDPLQELKNLYRILKPGGRIIFMVPYEHRMPYREGDINQHLFTWSEMNLGNLFTRAGYKVIESKEIHHRFPPFSNFILTRFGLRTFHFFSRINGFLNRKVTQIRIIAEKK